MDTSLATNYDNRGNSLVILGWILLAVSSLVIIVRIYVRVTRVRIAWDDWLMLLAWLCELLHIVFITLAWQNGLGRHFASLTPETTQRMLYWTAGYVELFAIFTCMFGRISFCLLLLFIISPSDTKKKVALWAVIVIQLTVNIATVIQIYTQCGTHVTAMWDFSVPAALYCQSPDVQTYIGYVQSGINSVCDVVLVALPILILWNLQMPMTQKVGLGAMLTLSIFALAASIVKAYQIQNLSAKNDFSWYMVDLQIWVVVENNVVMIAATIPTLAPLLRKTRESTLGSGPRKYNRSSQTPKNIRSNRSDELGGPKKKHDPYRVTTIDGNSEEYILQPMPVVDEQITKSVDVQISYESRSEAGRSSIERQIVPETIRNNYNHRPGEKTRSLVV